MACARGLYWTLFFLKSVLGLGCASRTGFLPFWGIAAGMAESWASTGGPYVGICFLLKHLLCPNVVLSIVLQISSCSYWWLTCLIEFCVVDIQGG